MLPYFRVCCRELRRLKGTIVGVFARSFCSVEGKNFTLWDLYDEQNLGDLLLSLSFSGKALVDLVQKVSEPDPQPNARAMCRDPILESKRAHVKPARVEPLLQLFFKDGKVSTCQLFRDLVRKVHTESMVPEIFRHRGWNHSEIAKFPC